MPLTDYSQENLLPHNFLMRVWRETEEHFLVFYFILDGFQFYFLISVYIPRLRGTHLNLLIVVSTVSELKGFYRISL